MREKFQLKRPILRLFGRVVHEFECIIFQFLGFLVSSQYTMRLCESTSSVSYTPESFIFWAFFFFLFLESRVL